jgi:hypothetical protein
MQILNFVIFITIQDTYTIIKINKKPEVSSFFWAFF